MGGLACQQARFLTTLLGGPSDDRSHKLAEAHRRLRLTDSDFDAIAKHLLDSLISLGVEREIADAIIDRVASLRDQVIATSTRSPRVSGAADLETT